MAEPTHRYLGILALIGAVSACGAKYQSEVEPSGAGTAGKLDVLGTAGFAASGAMPDHGEARGNGDIAYGTAVVTVFAGSPFALDLLHYSVAISGSGAPVAQGDVPIGDASTSFSFGATLPVGRHYQLSLVARPADPSVDIECVDSSQPFDIQQDTSTPVAAGLRCFLNTHGVGHVDVATTACPRLIFQQVEASALNSFKPPQMSLVARAFDLDGKPVTYSWQVEPPTPTTVLLSTGSTATLSCVDGTHALTVTVTASNGECTTDSKLTIACDSN